MKYIHILKDLIDNFYITTYPKDFILESNTFGYDKVIEGDAQVVCGRGRVLKDEWLNPKKCTEYQNIQILFQCLG